MIFLVILAALIMAALVISAGFTMHDVSQTDEAGAGSWGVMVREKRPKRRMTAQARRWQSSLTRAQTDRIRWGELVTYIDRLEATIDPSVEGQLADRPDQVDGRYLRARIDRLESLLESQHSGTAAVAPAQSASSPAQAQTIKQQGPDRV